MVKPAVQNFEWKQGVTWEMPMWLREKESGAPIDLTGASPVFRILTTPAPLDYTLANGKLTMTAPTTGHIRLKVTDAENGGYTWQTAKYYMAIRFANGDLLPYYEGTIKLLLLGG